MKTERGRVVTITGALLSATVASACCWLPLLLIVLGFSSAGVAVVFEKLRPWFIGASIVLLGAGFYAVYFLREECTGDASCKRADLRRRRTAQIILWVATVGVAAFIFLPSYIGALTEVGRGPDPARAPVVLTLQIDGMSCVGCAAGVREALQGVPGVESAAVSFEDARAVVSFSPMHETELTDLVDAVAAAGYEASELTR
ncbi:MAG: cation transporter [Candidatus Krumholzibacteriota bacterium]|nr:cation transporter [Candidatus Krumholzibacteriota bacterium]